MFHTLVFIFIGLPMSVFFLFIQLLFGHSVECSFLFCSSSFCKAWRLFLFFCPYEWSTEIFFQVCYKQVCVCVYLYFQTNNVFALSKSNWKKPLLSFCALILEKFGTNTEENPKDTSWQSGLTRTWRVSLPPLHTNIITQTPEAMLVWGVRCNILMQQEEFKNIFSRERKRQMAA